MINRTAIQQWSNHAPWIDNAQIEQDLIICRALVAIFSDEFLASQLAFRGGTALHKLYLLTSSSSITCRRRWKMPILSMTHNPSCVLKYHSM